MQYSNILISIQFRPLHLPQTRVLCVQRKGCASSGVPSVWVTSAREEGGAPRCGSGSSYRQPVHVRPSQGEEKKGVLQINKYI